MKPLAVTTTEAVDKAFYFIFGISGIMLLGIIVAMIWFCWRYNRKRQPVPISQKDHNLWLEVVWTVIPTILVLMMFWVGWEGYLSLRRVPDGAMPVHGAARMWSWLFTYENGKTSDKLYVPVGQPVNVRLIAEDVLHSFYVPAFRVKRDCVPGMETYAWFVAEKAGSYDLFCAEYCGVGHADMITTVEALPPAEFQAWLETEPAAADAGKELLQKHGCLGCHSLDGSRLVGPSFQGIGGRQVAVVKNGQKQTLTSDAAYLERAILEPNAEIVDGYPAAMPGYAGRIPADELAIIIDYLMSSEGESKEATPAAEPNAAAPEPAESVKPMAQSEPVQSSEQSEQAPLPNAVDLVSLGETVASDNGCTGCHSLDGSRVLGPSFKGLFGSERTVTRTGQELTITADADYLIRAIREPAAEITTGYPPAMPPYADLSDEEIEALLTWLESLK